MSRGDSRAFFPFNEESYHKPQDIDSRSFLEEEFAGAVRGLDHRFDERDAELAFFKFQNAVNGAAGRRGDRVFEQRRVIAGLEHYTGGTFHRLRGEQRSYVAWQADFHSSFRE